MNQKLLIAGVLFVFVFLFGYGLSRAGKPYNSLIFTFHKLIGLAMGIFLIVAIYQSYQTAALSPIETIAIGFTVIVFIALVVAGGILSIIAAGGLENISKSLRNTFSVIHKVFPYLAVLLTAAMLYLLLFPKI